MRNVFRFWLVQQEKSWWFFRDPLMTSDPGQAGYVRLDFDEVPPKLADYMKHAFAHVVAILAPHKRKDMLRTPTENAQWEVFEMGRDGGVELLDADTQEILWEYRVPVGVMKC